MAEISKAEYLKRYMSSTDTEQKIKKRKKVPKNPSKHARSKIIDDDVDIKSLLPDNQGITVDEYIGEEDPTIVAIIDERPDNIKQLESFRHSDGRWKTLGDDDQFDPSLLKSMKDEDIIKNKKFILKDSDKNTSNRTLDSRNSKHKRRQRHDSDSDGSLPRKGRHDSESDHSLPRKQRHDSDSDHSLPRKQRHNSDSDNSLPRKQRHDSDSDHSLPRKQRHDSDSDHSLPRKQRHDSDSDQSLPRKQSYDSDIKKHRRHQRHDSDSDVSPPRKRKNIDLSPPRRKRRDSDSDISPPMRKRANSGSDQSPARRKREDSGSDQSPPRRNHPSNPDSKKEKMDKTLSGKKAGLSSAKDMKIEAEKIKQKENEAFKKIGHERLGKDATTVFRDRKTGRKRNMKEEAEKDAEQLEKERKMAEKYQKWGKGIKQQEQQQKNLEEHLYEASKPLARFKDDEDLDKQLKDIQRAEDPMLMFLKKKKSKDEKKTKELPKYKGPAPPPNRFKIMPGYRWDGVDRSNGFEAKYFASISNKKAVSEAAYKWSVEDM